MNSTVASRFKWPPVSARWSGFILLQSSCSVTFLISSSNAFSIFFDSSELLSNRLDAFNPATSFTATSRVLSSSHFFQGAIECSGVANPAAAAVIIFIFIIIIIIVVVVVIVVVICFGQTCCYFVLPCCFWDFHGKFQGNDTRIGKYQVMLPSLLLPAIPCLSSLFIIVHRRT